MQTEREREAGRKRERRGVCRVQYHHPNVHHHPDQEDYRQRMIDPAQTPSIEALATALDTTPDTDHAPQALAVKASPYEVAIDHALRALAGKESPDEVASAPPVHVLDTRRK